MNRENSSFPVGTGPGGSGPRGVESPELDPVLSTALAAWRTDVRAVAPSSDLTARVLRAAADARTLSASAREDELDRVRRVARVYASAAAVLLAIGVGGALIARHGAHGDASDRNSTAPASLADLENHRMSLIGLDSVVDLTVGGR